MGEKGEGFTGATIKDTWTTTRGLEMGGRLGGLGVVLGWEKAENCT